MAETQSCACKSKKDSSIIFGVVVVPVVLYIWCVIHLIQTSMLSDLSKSLILVP